MPASYLKGWAGADGGLVVYRNYQQYGVKPSRKHPNAVGFKEDGYTVGDVNFEIEHFRDLDRRASDVFEILRSEGPVHLDADQGQTLVEFIQAQFVRCPYAISALDEIFTQRIEAGGTELDEWVRSEGVQKQILDEKGFAIGSFQEFSKNYLEETALKESVFRAMIDVSAQGKSRDFLADKKYSKFDMSGSGFKVLTSDRPIVVVPGRFLAMPVSPVSVLVVWFNDAARDEMGHTPRSKFIRWLNAVVVGQAVEYVFSNDYSQERFVLNRFSKNKSILPFMEHLASDPG